MPYGFQSEIKLTCSCSCIHSGLMPPPTCQEPKTAEGETAFATPELGPSALGPAHPQVSTTPTRAPDGQSMLLLLPDQETGHASTTCPGPAPHSRYEAWFQLNVIVLAPSQVRGHLHVTLTRVCTHSIVDTLCTRLSMSSPSPTSHVSSGQRGNRHGTGLRLLPLTFQKPRFKGDLALPTPLLKTPQ